MALLVDIGKSKFNDPVNNSVHLVDDKEGNLLLNDIVNYPHAYVLACCMDRQVNAEIAWMVPVKIWRLFGTFEMEFLQTVSLAEWKIIFNNNSLHRFNDKMAEIFYKAIQLIKNEYNGDASNIWINNPSSATVVYRFLQFEGVGVKIATMAANILARQFKIPFSDYCSIDVSPDVHVRRVMHRLGYVREDATNEEIIYKARELCPEFPGIIDYALWEIGRGCCRPTRPDCLNCVMKSECKTFKK